ncbi:class I SAM-dependent methyltransferase [Pseudonocardia endophytica]|uniref:Methyltransferase family protein n=1 Tax=Pseudonocardia endophytica TaxID=401976 RepID=A0A4V2PHI7_PSEEN|nr:class I SAM-dependent methyltransferase [Pseudonocardia endophytica]TCK20876.1 methyltransferase family protein [Pseudonocardia endophytica]
MITDPTCPACGDRARELPHVVEERYRLLRCAGCGTEFLHDPAPAAEDGTDSEYWEDYKFAVYASPDVRRGYEERYAFAFDRLAARTGTAPGSVLDVGCGIGNFLAWSSARGAASVGVDVDATAVAGARERGLTAVLPDGLDGALDGPVDVLTMWDVIEHVADPTAFVADVVDRLRPGGHLLLETPDAAFPVRPAVRAVNRLSGGRVDVARRMYYWEHKIYFTEEGLRRVFAPFGVDLVEVHRLTSPQAKMQATFDHLAEERQASTVDTLVARGWPVAEQLFRRIGRGNKLVALARKRG